MGERIAFEGHYQLTSRRRLHRDPLTHEVVDLAASELPVAVTVSGRMTYEAAEELRALLARFHRSPSAQVVGRDVYVDGRLKASCATGGAAEAAQRLLSGEVLDG